MFRKMSRPSSAHSTAGTSLFTPLQRRRNRRRQLCGERFGKRVAPLTIEPLEDRAMLATVAVTTTNDVVDTVETDINNLAGNPGTDGFVSLCEAIIAANTTSGADTINLAAGAHTISLAGTAENAAATGDFDITESLTLVGVGQGTNPVTDTIIDGGGSDRVFQVFSGVTAVFQDMTIQNGTTFDNGTTTATALGGGILSTSANITLDNVLLKNNSANGTFPGV